MSSSTKSHNKDFRDMDHIMGVIVAAEQSLNVEKLRYGDLRVWPLMREQIFDSFYYPEYPTLWPNAEENSPKKKLRLSDAARAWLQQIGQRDLLFWSRRSEQTEMQGSQHFNPYLDPAVQIARKDFSVLKMEMNRADLPPLEPRVENTVYIEGVPTEDIHCSGEIEGFAELRSDIEQITGCNLNEDFHRALVIRARTIIAWEGVFAEALEIVKPKMVFAVCYYDTTARALVRTCKLRSVPVADIEHGSISNQHCHYTHLTYFPETGSELLPHYFWSWGPMIKHNIESWYPPNSAHPKSRVCGHPRLTLWNESVEESQDAARNAFYEQLSNYSRVIVIALSIYELPEHLLNAMQQSPQDWAWLFRFHPLHKSDARRQPVIAALDGMKNCEYEMATSIPLNSLLKRANHLITAWSSCAYDALAFDVPTTCIEPSALMRYGNEMERGAFHYADTAEAILDSIAKNTELPEGTSKSDFIETDLETARRSLRGMVEEANASFGKAEEANKLGEAMLERGQIQAAKTLFNYAVQLEPRHAMARNNLGVLYWQAGETENSLRYFMQALEVAPDNGLVASNAIGALKAAGMHNEAQRLEQHYA